MCCGVYQDLSGLTVCVVVYFQDLDRQVVKSEWATISLPEVDFEQPPSKRGGELVVCNQGA